MRGVNKVILVGTLGRDAEVKHVGESQLASFSLATTEAIGRDDKRREKTEWHNIVLWGKSGVVRYLTKGTSVYIEGRIQTRSWENKEGVKVYRTEINAFNVVLLGSKKRSADDDNGWGAQSQGESGDSQRSNSDDIPF